MILIEFWRSRSNQIALKRNEDKSCSAFFEVSALRLLKDKVLMRNYNHDKKLLSLPWDLVMTYWFWKNNVSALRQKFISDDAWSWLELLGVNGRFLFKCMFGWSWTGDTTGGIEMKNKRTICLVFSDNLLEEGPAKSEQRICFWKFIVPLQLLWSSWMNPLGSPKPESHLERFGISECPFGTGTEYGSTDLSVVCGWILVVNLLGDLENLGTKTPTHPWFPTQSLFITVKNCQLGMNLEYLAHWYWRTECPMEGDLESFGRRCQCVWAQSGAHQTASLTLEAFLCLQELRPSHQLVPTWSTYIMLGPLWSSPSICRE